MRYTYPLMKMYPGFGSYDETIKALKEAMTTMIEENRIHFDGVAYPGIQDEKGKTYDLFIAGTGSIRFDNDVFISTLTTGDEVVFV